MRAGLLQLVVVIVAVVLGVVLPKITVGPQVRTDAAQPFLLAIAGGLIAFIALVFSLLFLMIQYATTTFTPRLTVFRDDPHVWRAFAVFIGAFVYSAIAGLAIGDRAKTSVLVPALALVLVLVSLGLARALQMRALRLLQMNATLEDLRARGARVLTRLYAERIGADREPDPLPAITQTFRWAAAGALLLDVDVHALRTAAAEAAAVFRLHVGVGEEVRRGAVVVTVHGSARPIADRAVFEHVHTGVDRTFDQDPLLAFRLLNDIAIRSLSPAINDPASAVSAIAAIDDLLRIVADRELDIGRVVDATGALRVVLKMPTWEDFLVVAVDDLAPYAAGSPMSAARLASLFDELASVVPPNRYAPLERRRRLAVSQQRQRSRLDAAVGAHGDDPAAVESPLDAPTRSPDLTQTA
jgi:uncharacterized membrane protein